MLYLLRHGQTEWSESGQHTSRTDIPLTPEGEQRARRAGRLLASLRSGPALVLSSPRSRALRTAELAGLTIDEVTEDLAEWDYGSYEGLTTQQIRTQIPEWTIWTHPSPGGETASEVGARATKLLFRVRDAPTDVILVGHGHFSRVLIATWLSLPPTHGVHFALDPAGIASLADERGVPQLHMLNLPPV